MTTPLYRLSLYFELFSSPLRSCVRMVTALRFSSLAEEKRGLNSRATQVVLGVKVKHINPVVWWKRLIVGFAYFFKRFFKAHKVIRLLVQLFFYFPVYFTNFWKMEFLQCKWIFEKFVTENFIICKRLFALFIQLSFINFFVTYVYYISM